jgi:site-specific DNA-cytosine methylase
MSDSSSCQPFSIIKKKPSQQTFLVKRRNIFKKVIDLAKQYDQDVFICVRDNKKSKVIQYSSDTKNFGLEQVSAHIKRQIEAKVQRLESAFEISSSKNEPNESTTESSTLSSLKLA